MSSPTELYEQADALLKERQYVQAGETYASVLDHPESSAELKLKTCAQLAETYYQLGDKRKERDAAYRSFDYDSPRAELCCRLGYMHFNEGHMEQAVFWYKLASQLDPSVARRNPNGLFYESCWTWLPHLQLSRAYYLLGQFDKAYAHNEYARRYLPNDEFVRNNRMMLEALLPKDKPKPAPLTKEVTIRNSRNGSFRMNLLLPGYIEDLIVMYGGWEPRLSQMFSNYMKKRSVFLDIGANIGYHTLYLASEHPQATCLCFDPHPDIFRQLKQNIQENEFANIAAHNVAVGDKPGSVDFHLQTDDNYNRGLSGIHYSNQIGSGFTISRVPVVTLDDFLDDEMKNKVGAMKIDTQGYEYEVLLGAAEVIERSKPMISFEYHLGTGSSLSDIISLLPNYKVFQFNSWTGEMVVYEPSAAIITYDFICLPLEEAAP